MNRMSSEQGMRLPEALSFSRKLIGGSGGGVLSGFASAQKTMYPENSAMRMKPGMKPARKMRMIEASAATAYTTMVIEGGIRMPSVPAVASDRSTVLSAYPRLSSSGSATLEMVAQVAADDPETEPKMPQPRIVVCMRRPGSRLSQGERPENISSD